MVELSIVIPAYNVAHTIAECIHSVVRQNRDNIEIIVVDDGSKDDTLEVCEKMCEEIAYLRVVHQENAGVSAARNHGIDIATGKWIMFIDGDDCLLDGSLNSIDFSKDYDLLVLGYSKELGNAKGSKKEFELSPKALQNLILNYAGQYKKIECIDTYLNWSCWARAFRREVIVSNSIKFPIGITHGEDLLFCYSYLKYARNALCVDWKIYFYRIESETVSHRFNSKRVENTLNLFSMLTELCEDNNPNLHVFVANRIVATCKLFFAAKENLDSNEKKIDDLKKFCEMPICNIAINNSKLFGLTIGRKRRLFYGIILYLLKKKNYKAAIGFARYI